MTRTGAAYHELQQELAETRNRLAAALWRIRQHRQAIKRLQRFIDRNWYGGDPDDFVDDELNDTPEDAEAMLRWANSQ